MLGVITSILVIFITNPRNGANGRRDFFSSVIAKILIGKKEWSKVTISQIRLHQSDQEVIIVILVPHDADPEKKKAADQIQSR